MEKDKVQNHRWLKVLKAAEIAIGTIMVPASIYLSYRQFINIDDTYRNLMGDLLDPNAALLTFIAGPAIGGSLVLAGSAIDTSQEDASNINTLQCPQNIVES